MKSKKIILITLLSLCIAACSALAACSRGGADNHVHTYSAEWTHDTSYHWHAATCAHSAKQGDKALHTFTASENEEGDTVYTCVCGYSYTEEAPAEREHDYTTLAVAATCTEGGYTLHRCKYCGDEYRTDETDAIAHNLVDCNGVAATCTEDGHTAHKVCTVCGYKTDYSVDPATGHLFSNNMWAHDANSHWHPAVCEHTTEISGLTGHLFGLSGRCDCGFEYTSEDEDKFTYGTVSGGLEITGLSLTLSQVPENIAVPATHNGSAVVAIADGAFKNSELRNIMLPASVTTIGREAFYGSRRLQSISFGEGLTEIGFTAFGNCTSLRGVSLPSALGTIRSYAFDGCTALETVEMPEYMSAFEDQIFRGCTALKSIKIPDGVTVISNYSFFGCASLESVEIPDGVTQIGVQAFAGCASLGSVDIPDGVTYIGQKAFKGSGLTEVTLPDSVTRLASYAFEDCVALSKVTLSRGLELAIADWFAGCESLEEISLPFVGDYKNSTLATSTAFGFIFGTKEQDSEKFEAVAQGGKTYYIPKSLRKVTVTGTASGDCKITANAFDNCSMITNITVASGVTKNTGWLGNCTATVA